MFALENFDIEQYVSQDAMLLQNVRPLKKMWVPYNGFTRPKCWIFASQDAQGLYLMRPEGEKNVIYA